MDFDTLSIQTFTMSDNDGEVVIGKVDAWVNRFLTGYPVERVVSIIPQVTETMNSDGEVWTRYTVTLTLRG